jgi:hypothetical protein
MKQQNDIKTETTIHNRINEKRQGVWEKKIQTHIHTENESDKTQTQTETE